MDRERWARDHLQYRTRTRRVARAVRCVWAGGIVVERLDKHVAIKARYVREE